MDCRRCGLALERPGDYCLACHTANAEIVVLDCERDRVRVLSLADDDIVAERTVTTRPEDDPDRAGVELRNFAGLVADELHRKRPEEVYATGDREVVAAIRVQVHYPFYRVADDDPVAAVRERRGDAPLEVVDASIPEKIGGSHSTLVGGREGLRAAKTVAGHPHVKRVVPGPIESGGGGSRSGLRANATRAGEDGNLRLRVRDGSSVQENRVITTAGSRDRGEDVRADLNELLREAALQDE